MQAVFGTAYNDLGLVEHCQQRGFDTAADVANARKSVDAVVAGMTVYSEARAREAVGRRGEIAGAQVIGLADSSNPARPEVRPMSLADNARVQTSEKTLCSQMAAQVAPLP